MGLLAVALLVVFGIVLSRSKQEGPVMAERGKKEQADQGPAKQLPAEKQAEPPLPSAPAPKPSTLKGHQAWVSCLGFSPDGKTLVSGSEDKTVRIWDVTAGKESAIFAGHTKVIQAVAFSPDGQTVATASSDKTVRVLDAATGSELGRFQGHQGNVYDVAYFPDGKTLLSSGDDKTIRRWARGSVTALDKYDNGTSVRNVAVAPDGKTFASSANQEVKLWRPGQARSYATLLLPRGAVLSISYLPGGKSLIGGTQEATIWNVESGAVSSAIKSNWRVLHRLRLNSTGEYLATSSSIGQGTTEVHEVKLFHVQSGKELVTLRRGSDKRLFLGIAFSPDTSTLAVGNQDGTISLLDIARYTKPSAVGAGDTLPPPAAGKTQADKEAWVQLFNGHDLRGWKGYPDGTGRWRVQNGLLCNNGAGNGGIDLFTERGDYRNFHCRIETKVEEGGNSGLFFRSKFGSQFKEGYEAQIEANYRGAGSGPRTGSLYGLVNINENLVQHFVSPSPL
jgi:WD40 repeat protein